MNFEKENIKNLLLDMDGVLWREAEPIGDLPAIFRRIHARGLRVVLATNNATQSVEKYLERLRGLGVTLEPWQIATSGQATVDYLQAKYPHGSRIHVMGEPGLMETIESGGYLLTDSDVRAVVVGVDRNVSYARIDLAARLVREGAEFLGTNPDRTFPTSHGLRPGAGAIIAAVTAAAEREPMMVGKPNRFLIDLALRRFNGSISESLMVGDRLETDILAAQNAGCKSCLVLSGVSTLAQAKQWQPAPNFIVDDLSALVEL